MELLNTSLLISLMVPALFLAAKLLPMPKKPPGLQNQFIFYGIILPLTLALFFGLSPLMEGLKNLFFARPGDVLFPYPGSPEFWILVGFLLAVPLGYILADRIAYPPKKVKKTTVDGVKQKLPSFNKPGKALSLYVIFLTILCHLLLNSYVRVSPKQIDVKSFFSLSERSYPWKDVKQIRVYVNSSTSTDEQGRESSSAEPQFDITFADDDTINLWHAHGLLGVGRTERARVRWLGKMAVSQGARISVDTLGLTGFEGSSDKEFHERDPIDSIPGTFHYIQRAIARTDKYFAINETVSLREIEYRVLKIERNDQVRFCKPGAGQKTMEVLLEIRNKGKQPFSITGVNPGLLQAHKGKAVKSRLLCKDKFETEPGGVVQGRLRFRVDTKAQKFTFILKPYMFKEERIYWKFGDK